MPSSCKLLAFLELLSVASAAFQLDFTVERRSSSSISNSRFRRRDHISTSLTNSHYEVLYLIDVAVGSPLQKVKVNLDTGSDELWFPYPGSAPCTGKPDLCVDGTFDPSSSSTYKVVNKGAFNITYADTSGVSGDYFTDDLSIGGKSIKGLRMGIASDVVLPDGQKTDPFQGILGVTYKTDAEGNPTTVKGAIDLMKEQGLISSRAFSIWLNSITASTGSILFGGVDKAKYEGDLVALPIQLDADTGTIASYTVVLDNIGAGNKSGSIPISTKLQAPIIPDSGSTNLQLPQDLVDLTAEAAGCTNSSLGWFLDCDARDGFEDEQDFVSFQFGNSDGPTIKVPFSQLVVDLKEADYLTAQQAGYTNTTPICSWGVQPADTGASHWLFGDTFMRSAYIVYDQDNKQVAMAQAKYTTDSDIEDITGTSIPGVSSTATGTYTSPPPSAGVTAPFNLGNASLATGLVASSGGVSTPSFPSSPAFTGAVGAIQAPSASFTGLVVTGTILASGMAGIMMVLL